MLLSFLWVLFLLAVTLYLLWRSPKFSIPKNAIWFLFGIALLARLTPSFFLADTSNYDIQSFQLTGEVLSRGQDVYSHETTQNRHPYLPLQVYVLQGSFQVSEWLGLPFPFIVRLVPLTVDAALAALLFFSLLRCISKEDAFRWGLVYALNPITIMVSAYQGQFDTIPTTLTLLALLWVPRSAWGTGLFLGLGVLNKSWPVLAWPQIMANLQTWKQRVIVSLLMGVIPLVGVGLYAWFFDTNPLEGLRKAISYNWGAGIWGYTYFLRMFLMRFPGWPQIWNWFLNISRYLTLGVLAGIWFFRTRFQTPTRGLLGLLLGFLACGHAFSIQYLLWPVAFAVYVRDRIWLARFIIGASAYMILAYYTLIFQNVITKLLPWPQADWYIIIPAGIPVWLVIVFWLRASVKKLENSPLENIQLS